LTKSSQAIDRGRRPADFVPLDYRSALVPIFGGDVSVSAMQAAARFVGEDATVDAVYVINVPAQIPLDGPLAAEEDRGRGVLEAYLLAERPCRIIIQTGPEAVSAAQPSRSSRPRWRAR
jgi:hypothetical protein